MLTLCGKNISLRALEPEDIEFIYEIENDESIWCLSNTQTPYSKFLLKSYLDNAFKDIFEAKQLRLAVTRNEEVVGLIDLFDFDFKNHKAGVGILIKNEFRQKGIGNEALQLLANYCFTHLQLHQLYSTIAEDNHASINLFKKQGFQLIGLQKDWIFIKGTYKNVYLFQLINNHVH